jgi:threonine dehydrogenase-like Zn-dependent dehydrogenase
MNAIVLQGKQCVECVQVDFPQIIEDTDAIVQVKIAGLCGSDLHPFHGREPCDTNTIMGHEFVGIIHKLGSAVQLSNLKIGSRVVSSFTTACLKCKYCTIGLTSRCVHAQLFGYSLGGKGLMGGQAQFVRVPMAESTLQIIPPNVSDEKALFAGDILSTGYFCAENAGLERASSCCVVGCGPVGLLAIKSLKLMGIEKIYAVDMVSSRLRLAEKFGAKSLLLGTSNVKEYILSETSGIGVDAVLELVGNPPALRLAYDLVRPGGTISSIGCHTAPNFPFTPAEAYDKNITFKTGRCPARHYMQKLLPMLSSNQYDDVLDIITHRMRIQDAKEAYSIFDEKKDDCIKIVFEFD